MESSTPTPESLLQPSLITSFSVKGSQEAVKKWPKEIENVELYAFMHQDLPLFFDVGQKFGKAASRHKFALCVMADALQSSEVEAVAERINRLYQGKKIVALATFLPEIVAFESNDSVWKLGQDAMLFLIDLVRQLKTSFGHPISTIHLSGGSRTDGMMIKSQRGVPDMFYVKRVDRAKAIRRLLERLERVAAAASNAPQVRLAVELEPGPWYTVGGRETLLEFCGSLASARSDQISSVVGVNLDIPHWDFLSRITPEWLMKKENEFVLDHILHCHVSDHSNGHFGCSPIGTFHAREKFGDWIQFIAKKLRPRNRRFSGFISCEMEGCKEVRFVQESVLQLKNLVRIYS